MSLFGKKNKKVNDFPEEQTGLVDPLISVQVMPELGASDQELHRAEGGRNKILKTSSKEIKKQHAGGSDSLTNIKSKKIIITSGVVVLVLFIAGATWYYAGAAKRDQAKRLAALEAARRAVAEEQAQAILDAKQDEKPEDIGSGSLVETFATETPKIDILEIPKLPSDILTFLDEREYTLGLDLDGDQLSDKEEVLYNTDTVIPDTDGDTFPDGWEIVNLYNPSNGNSAQLLDAPFIEKFVNNDYGYEIFVLKGLTLRAADQADMKELTLTAPSTEYISITVEPNPHNLNIRAWLREKYGSSSNRIILNRFTTKNKASGWMTTDGLTKYFVSDVGMLVWRYEFGRSTSVNFKQTWDMMSAAFVFTEPSAPLLNEPPAEDISTSTPEIVASDIFGADLVENEFIVEEEVVTP